MGKSLLNKVATAQKKARSAVLRAVVGWCGVYSSHPTEPVPFEGGLYVAHGRTDAVGKLLGQAMEYELTQVQHRTGKGQHQQAHGHAPEHESY